jgi:subtilisin family serine protease
MINADDAWQLGYRGAGIVIGQSDSGVQGDHPELADAYLGVDGEDDYHWFDPWYETVSPMDIGGHGTHTLGTILGDHTGVAPDAGWIGCVNLARNLGNPAYYLDCMQFMLAPFPQDGDPLHDGEPDRGAHILNNSWGCPSVEGCDPSALQPAVTALRAAGIFVVASAGNNGDNGCGTVEDPIAIYDDVFTVGAIDQGGDLTGFSSLGPVEVDGSGRIKPDIVAPGANIPSAFPGGTYAFLSGTSMAGPHVAGVVALMWSANPHLIGDIDLTETILRNSATTYDGWIP